MRIRKERMRMQDTRHVDIEQRTNYQRLHQDIGTFFHNPDTESWLSREQMGALCQEISDKITALDPVTILECINAPRQMDEGLQRHSLNVAFLNGIQAGWLELDRSRVKKFILAGLLHDVGKTMIPEEIVNAPRRLTAQEMDVMRMHPVYSDGLLRDKFDDEIRSAARHHHEKLNGKGYPDGIAEKDIGLCARVTAISDIYDAMVSARSYKSSRLPLHVLNMFYAGAFEGLDRKLVLSFVKNMRLKYTDRQVVMSDGTRAAIRYIPVNDAAHPIVQQGADIRQTDEEWYCRGMAVEALFMDS
ncbi:MAG: HD domain-containing protein [Lachnospiraceae bacterium]|nr:HD domain-containing protein [Lachnospiraceae bacterium]